MVARGNKRAWPLLLAAGTALLTAAVLLMIKTFYWPQSFLPTRWSDFTFWRTLIESWQADWKAMSLMTPLPKEIQLFRALRQCAVLMLTALLAGGWCLALICAMVNGETNADCLREAFAQRVRSILLIASVEGTRWNSTH